METLERLGPEDLKAIVVGYRDALRVHQEAVNRLNVYPVPDGDTGTNMALTLESVVAEVGEAAGMPAICKAISHGSLMGARGNSGVILSQILRGVADGFREVDSAGPEEVASAFEAAADAAYKAVMKPVEGTILTVVRAAAGGATEAADAGKALVDVLDGAKLAAADALARTPELLAVLAQAGVVDAGGAGFCLLLDAMLNVAAGRPVPTPTPTAPCPVGTRGAAGLTPEVAAAHAGDISDLRYEVMYFLEAPDDTVAAFREVWAGIGDSIVVVGGDGIWNCHIHTDDIGAAIEAAVECGRPRQIRVTDLIEQVQEERWVREAATGEPEPPAPDLGPLSTAVVAIATGAGIGRLFRSVGVGSIVAGGQSMNPSTAQILDAVIAAPADEVVILPNNKNIIPVAEQVALLASKTVVVVPTRSITEGLAAAFAYDPQGDAATNAAAMQAVAQGVVTGELTRAVRDSVCDVGPVAEGDYLGLTTEGIAVVAPTLGEAACALLECLIEDDHEIVTVLEGEGATAGATRQITEWLGEHRPDVSADVHHGGQPLYPYLLSIE